MPSNKLLRITIILLIILTNISCDQVSKKIIRHSISENQTIGMLGNHLFIMRVENSGAFLSVGDSLSKTVKNILLSALPLIALVFGSIYIFAKHNMPVLSLIAISFIIGGGIGNIFDRIAYGSVTDFMYIHFGIIQTGIFNMADLSITTGAMIIFLQSLYRRTRAQ
jgi:signal peptidase II